MYGKPEIFNSDQGSQYTAQNFVNTLINNNISVSMDSKGRAIDNIFVERFWRTIKYKISILQVIMRLKTQGLE